MRSNSFWGHVDLEILLKKFCIPEQIFIEILNKYISMSYKERGQLLIHDEDLQLREAHSIL